MIEVQIFGTLSDYWIVEFGKVMYLILDQDLLFSAGKVYTYPEKLRYEYHIQQNMALLV